jgi:hypothetical protein
VLLYPVVSKVTVTPLLSYVTSYFVRKLEKLLFAVTSNVFVTFLKQLLVTVAEPLYIN